MRRENLHRVNVCEEIREEKPIGSGAGAKIAGAPGRPRDARSTVVVVAASASSTGFA